MAARSQGHHHMLNVSVKVTEVTNTMNELQAVVALGALAQSARLRVFRALMGAGLEGMTPTVIAATLGLPASTLSFHLRGLLDAGLVEVHRTGRHLIYRPCVAQMNALLSYLTAHCCGGEPCGLTVPPAASGHKAGVR